MMSGLPRKVSGMRLTGKMVYCELPKKSPPKQILGLMRNKKILKIRRFARNFACNRPDFMVK